MAADVVDVGSCVDVAGYVDLISMAVGRRLFVSLLEQTEASAHALSWCVMSVNSLWCFILDVDVVVVDACYRWRCSEWCQY